MKGKFRKGLLDNWVPKALSVVAAILLSLFFQINNLKVRNLSIPLEVKTRDGMVVSGDLPQSVRVELRGDEDFIYSIQNRDIKAVADFTIHEDDGSYRVPVAISVAKTYQLAQKTMEIKVEPSELTAALEEELLLDMEVTPRLKAFPPRGFEMVQYFVNPSSVLVRGPRSQLEGTGSIETEVIDLSGRDRNFSMSVRLISPGNNVDFPGGGLVEFQGIVEEAVISRTLTNLEVASLDLNPRLLLAGNLPEASITLQGSQHFMAELRIVDIHFFLDCSRITHPGTYTLPLQLDVPEGLAVLKYHPREIIVQVEQEESP